MTEMLKKQKKVLLELLKEFDRICKQYNISYIVFCGTAIGAVRHQGFIPWDDDLDVAMLREDYERFLKIAPSELSEQYYLQAEFSEHWPMNFSKLRKNNTTYLEKYHPKDKKSHQGIYIDIFPCDNAKDTVRKQKYQFYASRVVVAKSLFKRGYETNSKAKKFFMGLCSLFPTKPFQKYAKGEKISDSAYVHTFLACTSKFKKGIYRRKWFTETIEMPFEDMFVPVSAHYDELLTTMYGDYMQLPSEEERKIKEHAILIDTEKNYTEYENYRDGMVWDIHTRNIH